MIQLSIMIALIAALVLGNADGVSHASRAETQKGINPVQHSE
jgi:hypothetical protein